MIVIKTDFYTESILQCEPEDKAVLQAATI